MDKTRNSPWVHVALVFTALVWGASYPALKWVLAWLTAMEVALLRFWLILPILIAIVLLHRKEVLEQARRFPVRILLMAFFGVAGYHLPLNYGTKILAENPENARSAAMIASILVGTLPAWTGLFARVLRVETLSARQWLGQGIALIGVSLIITRGGLLNLEINHGAALVLLAPMAWGINSVVSRPLFLQVRSSLPVTAFCLIVGIFFLSFVPLPGLGEHLAAMPASAWVALVFLALFSTLIGYIIWAMGVKRLGANRSSLYIYLIPFFGLLMSVLLLDERLGLAPLLGGLLVLPGVMMARRAKS
ncbi:MAG: DMT family transporter [Candidatus Krumholzibacteria bacterium]|jgi:drug/metabolite transporter (DMT)-like permease|nr:DMT family transporter [Candidatus Krumholzibacteria bacterium]MDP6669403.1 DMT family transporter [Candidatus Krumholzibacteria bacterium]MDP6797963.1 DMT family transporter [Candidatus Krumholzibacteria bacterium]MDP7021882.1 DMT family transporter [Candidatus Krumholzibacteria bacterium]